MQRAIQYGAYGYGKLKNILAIQGKAPGSLPECPNGEEVLSTDLDVDVPSRDLAYYEEGVL